MSSPAVKVSLNKIEKLGLEPVPNELKKTGWLDYFVLQLAFSVNSGNFLIPALAVINGGLSFFAAILSTVFGAAAAFLFVSALSLPGSRYGLPAQYAIRSILGIDVSRYIASPIRTITSLYWFCVQTLGGTLVLQQMSKRLFDIQLPFTLVSMLMAALMAVLALIGFEAVKKTIRLFMPLLFIGQAVLLYLFIDFFNNHSSGLNLYHQQWGAGEFLFYSSLTFVQYISGVSASSDMSRYAKSSANAFWGLFAGNTAGYFMTALLAAFSAVLIGEWNPFVAASTMSQSKLVQLLILFCGITSMISINLNNAYTGGFSLLNTFPKFGRVKSSAVFGTAAIILSLFPILIKEAQMFISMLGMLIIPLSAVIVCDFLFIKKAKISVETLEQVVRGTYSSNYQALYSIAAGSAVYFFTPKEYSQGFAAFLITIVFYFLLKNRTNRTGIH